MKQEQLTFLNLDESNESESKKMDRAQKKSIIKDEPTIEEDLFEDEDKEEIEEEVFSPEPQVHSVSELNSMIRSQLEGEFPLIWVQGEISNFKAHSSGHFYFSLKDSKSQINAVMFRGFNSRLQYKPESGMEVLVRGRITVYEPRGNYQVFCELMEPVGQGALQIAFEQLKAKLSSEGLFDSKRKRPLPNFPRKIGIVTSPTGAAIRDMLNVLSRRQKGIEILLIPASVQGTKGAQEIVQAIELANRVKDLDVLIVGRGGGSIEDLWNFNEEIVARAISNSRVPTISAVGHEVDFTIADFVADLRAPTPSAAAELVVKNTEDLIHSIERYHKQLFQIIGNKIKITEQKICGLQKRLVDPKRRLQDLEQKNDELLTRLENSINRNIELKKSRVDLLYQKIPKPSQQIQSIKEKLNYLSQRNTSAIQSAVRVKKDQTTHLSAILDSLSPLKTMERGYSISKIKTEIIKSISQVKPNELIQVFVSNGRIDAKVIGTCDDQIVNKDTK